MNVSIRQLFLVTAIGFFYTPAVLPTKSRDHRHAMQKRTLALRGVKKQTTDQVPVSNKISKKYCKASYIRYEITDKPALYDNPNAVDLLKKKSSR